MYNKNYCLITFASTGFSRALAIVYGITHNIDTNNQLKNLIHEYVHVVSEISK